jgi:hypothetical protein
MRYIKNYKNYQDDKKIEILEGIKLDSYDTMSVDIFNKILKNYKVNETIKIEINNYINNNIILNESFFDKFKDRFPKASTVSNLLSDKAESILNSILQKTKDILSFVKKISEGIKELFLNTIEVSKKYYIDQIKNGKLKGKIEEIAKTKKEGLIRDTQEVKKVIDFYRKEFLSKLINSSQENLSDFLSKEQEPVVESLLLEKGNVIATLVHGIESIPPFSWLHKLAQAGEAGASQFIKFLSDITTKIGGPSFTLPVIALIVGVVFEQVVKGQAGGWLLNLAGSTTPFGMAISGMKMIASFIALLTVIDATIGEKILGHAHSEEEKEEKLDNSNEIPKKDI